MKINKHVFGAAVTGFLVLAMAIPACAQTDIALYKKHFDQGYRLYKGGQVRQAIEEYQKAIAVDPLQVEAYIELAAVYREQGRVNEAISTLKKATQEQRASWLPYYSLGIIYLGKKEYANADQMFMQARERDPKNLKVAVTQGYSRYLAGNAKGALEVLESARAIDPDNPDVSADIGLATILDGRKDEGLRILAQAAKKWPENPWVIKSYNEALWNEEEAAAAGLPKESGALHEKMKTLEGVPAALALIQMAELALHAEPPHAAKAIEYLSRAQERQNELSALRQGVILSLKAKADVILGKPDEARDELRKALKLCPGDESLLYQFAVLLARNGNNREALQALKNSLLAAPSEEAVESIRKRAAAEKGFDSLRSDPQFQKLIRPAREAANK